MFSRRRKLFSSSRHRRPSEGPLEVGSSSSASNFEGRSNSAENKEVGGLADQDDTSGTAFAGLSASIGSTLVPTSRLDTISPEPGSDPLGLSLLHTPNAERAADIIFVHGLGGSSRLTWCKNRRLDTFWPQQWLPKDEDLCHARILSFGYNAHFRSSTQISAMGVADFAKNLLYDMLFARDLHGEPLQLGEVGSTQYEHMIIQLTESSIQVPIIFVAHSMGGLVFKKAYLEAQLDSRYSTIIQSIKGVIFLSTPHRGTDLAVYLNRILSMSFSSTSKQYITELSVPSSFLRTINEQFRHVANQLQIFSFYETLQSSIGVSSALILDPESAKLGYPGEVSRSLDANHYNVCKFESPHDPNFRVVIGALKSLVSSYRLNNTQSSDQSTKLRELFSISTSMDHDFGLFSGRRAEGTCQWILEEAPIRSWLSSSSHSEVVMLQGRPGRGKSVIAAFLVQHLSEHGAAVQYFFFRSGDESKRSVATMIRSLAFQIAQQLPSFRKSLVDMADSGYKMKDSEWRSTWKHIFVNLLFEMEFRPPIYWVIDGIDEASSPDHLFELLSDLQCAKFPIKVLLTNRWSQGLLSAFERTGSKVSTSILSIDNDMTDIEYYVERELSYNNWGKEITEKVVQQVLETSNDNFLWVHLILDELKECNTEEDIWERLLELPPGMDGLYQRMEESIRRIRRPSDQRLASQLLTWAIHTRRALAVDELADILEPDFGRFLDLASTTSRLCGHFIAFEGDNKIGLIHQTAREYLTSSSTLPFSLSSIDAHGELFKQSMTCFLDKGLRSKLQHASPKLLECRATTWPYHLAATDLRENGNSQLDLLTQFFTKPAVLIWINVLALLDQQRVLIETSRTLSNFVIRKRKIDAANDPTLRRFDELEVLEGWSRDLLKLLGKFGSCLTQKPDIIFTSIAPFCPTSSSIYKIFGEQQADYLNIKGLPEEWDNCLARVSVGSECVATLICCSGRYIAVSNSKNTINIWDCTTFHQVRELELGEAASALCFNSRGDRLAAYGFRRTEIWSPQTGKLLLSIPNFTGMQALCLQFVDNDSAIIMGSDHRCVLRASLTYEKPCTWSMIDSQLLNDVEVLEGTYLNSPVALEISPNGSKIAATYRRFPLTVWSIASATVLKRLMRPKKLNQASHQVPFVSKISWHPGGDEILGIYMDGSNFKWNIVDGSYQEQPPSPGQMPSDIICSPDGLVFAICEVSGTVRLFDYQSSTLIYQLNAKELITAFCFSLDGRKFYDIRGSHCTIWEPNALMRLATVDDDPALSQATDESIRQSQVASESFMDNSLPVVLMSPSPKDHIVCFGNEEGAVELFDYETSERVPVGQTASRMSIEYLAWSEDGKRICYAELGGRLTVVQLEQRKKGRRARRIERFKPEVDTRSITQLLFLPDSNSLLISSSNSVQCWSLGPARIETTWDSGLSPASRKWTLHPLSSEHLLSITPESVSVHKRSNLELISTFHWESAKNCGSPASSGSELPDLNRALSGEVNMADFHEDVDSIDPTFVDCHVLIKISRCTSSRKLRPRFIIFDVRQLSQDAISPIYVPFRVSQMVEMPLNVISNGKLVFLDKSFWVCSWHIGQIYGTDDVQRHFFIPQDWLPLQSLGLLQITSSGTILCPRKGGVSVIHSQIGEIF